MSRDSGVEISGADWKEFSKSPEVFGDESSWDDTLIFVDGVKVDGDASEAPDGAVVRVECGYIERPVGDAPEDLVDCIRWWLDRRETVNVVVRVSRTKIDELRAAAEALGATLTGA